ncbi:hypothetical protein ACHAXA_005604 [Cyclostephanos tholiformis]|uniref:Uncharacterized protein n=1 Tax=Cyclostephanos tholiformis TaxID=382380 RepID=A0ABD3SGX8_9STRA
MPSSFLDKFEVCGPTLTLVLRDPSTAILLPAPPRGGWAMSASERHRRRPPPENDDSRDDGMFGLSSKVAALFHIGTTSGQALSTSSSSGASNYPNGYLRDDDGGVISNPSCDSTTSPEAAGLFSLRDARGFLSEGTGAWGESLSRYARAVHPELRFGMTTRNDGGDVPPFPAAAPWITGASCEATWSPFPIHEFDKDGGYGHEMMSAPRVVRVGARVSVPRVASLASMMTSRWLPRRSTSDILGRSGTTTKVNDDGDVATTTTTIATTNGVDKMARKELDVGIAYRRGRRRAHLGGGTLEFVLGGIGSDLPPSAATRSNEAKKSTTNNNHLLVRLAVGRGVGTKVTMGDSIEFVRGSFGLPNPLFFLRGRGMSVMPSYDFVEKSARCVLSTDVGSTGRTRAVLRLDADDSTLTVVRALDERRVFFKIIAPTISLNSGKIVYDYFVNLDGRRRHDPGDGRKKRVNSSIRAHVDPTRGIILKWTDGIVGGGGGGSCWVTECRVPLGTSGPGPLATDVRVGRRWVI